MSKPHWLQACVASMLLVLTIPASAAWPLVRGAEVHPPYQGPVPAKSDIIFTTRFKRDEALGVARDFGATRIEWVYSSDADYVRQLLGVAPWFGGTVNANGPLPDEQGFARDFDGNVIVVPWMKGWNGRWITTNSPQTRQVLAEQVQRFIELGAKSIQVDDPILQMHPALFQGGDFNPATLGGFERYVTHRPDKDVVAAAGLKGFQGDYREYLKKVHGVKDTADYIKRFRSFPSTRVWLDYLRDSVELHYSLLRDKLHKAGVALSMNLTQLTTPDESYRSFFLTPFPDYAVVETHIKEYPTLLSQAATMRSLGIGFVPSIQPLELADNRVALATAFALGAPPMVPWDTYIGNDDKGKAKRYFGKAGELSDIYRFAREHRELLDGRELDAVVGIVVPVDKFKGKAAQVKDLIDRLAALQIPFAFVPTGGTVRQLPFDASRLEHFKALVVTHGEADYDAATVAALRRTRVQRLGLAQADGAMLAGLQPFQLAPGAETVRLFPRSAPGQSKQLELHLVDTTQGAWPVAETACKRRLAIRNEFLGDARVVSATWTTGGTRRRLDVDRTPRATLVSVDDCPLWGVVQLQLSH